MPDNEDEACCDFHIVGLRVPPTSRFAGAQRKSFATIRYLRRRCHVARGDFGFPGWWGWGWGYPYGYGYGYPYGYYGYGYGDPYGYGGYGYGGYGYGDYGYGNGYGNGYGYGSGGQNGGSQYGSATRSRVAELQRRLSRAGYYRGSIDGVLGPQTRRAIRAYEQEHGYADAG